MKKMISKRVVLCLSSFSSINYDRRSQFRIIWMRNRVFNRIRPRTCTCKKVQTLRGAFDGVRTWLFVARVEGSCPRCLIGSMRDQLFRCLAGFRLILIRIRGLLLGLSFGRLTVRSRSCRRSLLFGCCYCLLQSIESTYCLWSIVFIYSVRVLLLIAFGYSYQTLTRRSVFEPQTFQFGFLFTQFAFNLDFHSVLLPGIPIKLKRKLQKYKTKFTNNFRASFSIIQSLFVI